MLKKAQELCPRYKFGKEIGRGSFSKCILAEYTHKKTGKTDKFACKWITKNQNARDFIDKFLPREIRALCETSNKHPYIIELHRILESDCSIFIFMRHAEKGDLLSYLHKHKRAPESQTNLWAYQIASALQYLHGMDYAHRDLKLENIFLTKNDNIRIGDFGFALFCGDLAKNSDGHSLSEGEDCGTASYAAPEIIKRGSYDPKKGDIWSLGVVVFTLLYGEMPFVFNKQIYENQMKRSYTLRQKKLKINLQPDCIEFLSELLEPNAAKRPDIHAVCALEWLDKDIIVVG